MTGFRQMPMPLRAPTGEGRGRPTPHLPDAQRFAIGDVTVTALSDGMLRLGPEMLSGIDEDGYAHAMRARFHDPETWHAGVNGFLIETGGRRLLVDTGTGGAMGPHLGHLHDNLRAAGTTPEEIDTLILSHLHPDHVGGACDADGAPLFPNAEVALSEADRAFWSDDGNASDETRPYFDTAQSVLAAYRDRLVPFQDGADLGGGVSSVLLPGHTPGHSGFLISSGDATLLLWTDIFHVAPVQMAYPEVTIGFDVDPDRAAETRKRTLDRVTSDRTLVAGSHITFPGLGHLRRDGAGYDFVPAPYPYPS